MNLMILLLLFLTCRENLQSQPPAAGQLLINEILFNPVKDGYDYVEVYNASERAIDLQDVSIATRNSTGDVSGIRQLVSTPLILLPASLLAITANEKWLRQHYSLPTDALVCEPSSLPFFPDDQGTAILLNSEGTVVDELHYSSKWHLALLTNVSGVSLERISYLRPAQDQNNWTSASSSSGYGTPSAKNSQYQEAIAGSQEVLMPLFFSPDNDGTDDVALIQYNMKQPGYIANTVVYDITGRKVRYLLKNESLGTAGTYKWDGLDDQAKPLPVGIYIVVSEIFNVGGTTKRFKNAVTLARR